MKKIERSKLLRAFNSLCTALLMASAIYIMAMGFHSVAMAAVAVSAAGVVAPIAHSSEGILDILIGTFEAMIDGVVAIIECMTSAITGLFS